MSVTKSKLEYRNSARRSKQTCLLSSGALAKQSFCFIKLVILIFCFIALKLRRFMGSHFALISHSLQVS